LRLTAVSALLRDDDWEHVGDWLRRASALNPGDARAALLARVYAVSPRLCFALLRAISPFRKEAADTAPFADLARARAAL
jgi:hypothetical protein